MDVVSTLIRSEISLFDEAQAAQATKKANGTPEDEAGETDDEPSVAPRVLHGSIRPSCTLAELAQAYTDDLAFRGIRTKLAAALAKKLKIQRANIQNGDIVSTILSESSESNRFRSESFYY